MPLSRFATTTAWRNALAAILSSAALSFATLSWAALPAAAQDSGPTGTLPRFITAFAGDWVSYDPSMSRGGQCRIRLQDRPDGAHFAAEAASCAGGLSEVKRWGIVDNQMALLDATNQVLARLGGNQSMISGTLANGHAVVLEREPMAEERHARWTSMRCLYLGYSSQCAPASDRGLSPSGAPSEVTVLVKLNAHSEPRPDAKVLTVLAPRACLQVRQCLITAAGPWCQVSKKGTTGWISKQAVRLGKFPVITFVSGCGGTN